MLVSRDWSRSEDDDFRLRVAPHIGQLEAATPLCDEKGVVVAWKIKLMYE